MLTPQLDPGLQANLTMTLILFPDPTMLLRLTLTHPSALSQEACNLLVARVPRHFTTLARFTALTRLSLLGTQDLQQDEVCS